MKKKPLRERNPFLAEVRLAVITGIVSLAVGWLLIRLETREPIQVNILQSEQIQRLSDSLTKIRNDIKDSLAILRKLKKPVVVYDRPPNP